MINTFLLEGTLQEISELKETDKGTKYARLSLNVQRPFRNSEGNFESDRIEIELWRGVAEVCCDNSSQGDLLGVQGRIQSTTLTSNEGKNFLAYKFIAEKVSFLSHK